MLRKIKPDLGLSPGGSFPNENAQNGKIRSELARLNVTFRRPGRGPNESDLDSTVDNLEAIAKHTRETKGGDALLGEDKHWDLSTLEFYVDEQGDIVGYKCKRD